MWELHTLGGYVLLVSPNRTLSLFLLTVMSRIKPGLFPIEADVRARLIFTSGF